MHAVNIMIFVERIIQIVSQIFSKLKSIRWWTTQH